MTESFTRLLGQLLIPLILVLVMAGRSPKGSQNNAIIIAVVTAVFVLMLWNDGMTIIIGVLIIGMAGIISIYTKKELPKKNIEKEKAK